MKSVVKESYDFGVALADDPMLIMEDDVLSAKECEHIMAQAVGQLKVAAAGSDDMGVEDAERLASTCWLKHEQTPIIRNVVHRVADLIGIPPANAEALQVVRYGEGQGYSAHFDAYDLDTDRGQRRTARGGQRLVTALLYLNTVESGGRTEFPQLGLDVPAIEGRVAVFHNTYPQTTTVHPGSEHCGLMVETGEKWACNLWFREDTVQSGGAAGRPRMPGARTGPGKGGANRKKNRKKQKASRKKNR